MCGPVKRVVFPRVCVGRVCENNSWTPCVVLRKTSEGVDSEGPSLIRLDGHMIQQTNKYILALSEKTSQGGFFFFKQEYGQWDAATPYTLEKCEMCC